MELQLQHLSKRYGTKCAVDNVNINLVPGVYGLLGANGAGKTTLMRMICGVLKPGSGTIRLNGKTMEGLGERYYTHLGYMPQNFGFYPDFTAREFMLYMAAVKGLDKKEAKTRTENLLHMVNLQDVADKKIKSYSGGMKQRLGIAQAELNSPSILILDEPTAGLDPKERVRFRNIISDFAKEKSTLIVMVVSLLVTALFFGLPIMQYQTYNSPNGTTGAYNLILFLLPYRSTMPEISKYISYEFGSVVLDVLSARTSLYVVLSGILLPLAGLGF